MPEDAEEDELDLESWERDLEGGLDEALPGLRIVDRSLELGEGRRADLVGIDEDERLVLILLVDAGAAEAPLLALEALAFARDRLGPLARHLGEPGLRTDLEPRIVVVAEGYGPGVLARLRPLFGQGILCFELQELRSARGTATYVVPVEASPAPSQAARQESFLAALPAAQAELAGLLLRRLRRVDPAAVATIGAESIQWRLRGRPLCALSTRRGELEARIGAGEPTLAIRSEGDVEALVEEILERATALTDSEHEGLRGFELRPPDAGIVLSPEEIAAFHS